MPATTGGRPGSSTGRSNYKPPRKRSSAVSGLVNRITGGVKKAAEHAAPPAHQPRSTTPSAPQRRANRQATRVRSRTESTTLEARRRSVVRELERAARRDITGRSRHPQTKTRVRPTPTPDPAAGLRTQLDERHESLATNVARKYNIVHDKKSGTTWRPPVPQKDVDDAVRVITKPEAKGTRLRKALETLTKSNDPAKYKLIGTSQKVLGRSRVSVTMGGGKTPVVHTRHVKESTVTGKPVYDVKQGTQRFKGVQYPGQASLTPKLPFVDEAIKHGGPIASKGALAGKTGLGALSAVGHVTGTPGREAAKALGFGKKGQFIGELVGDPLNFVTGGAGAALKGASATGRTLRTLEKLGVDAGQDAVARSLQRQALRSGDARPLLNRLRELERDHHAAVARGERVAPTSPRTSTRRLALQTRSGARKTKGVTTRAPGQTRRILPGKAKARLVVEPLPNRGARTAVESSMGAAVGRATRPGFRVGLATPLGGRSIRGRKLPSGSVALPKVVSQKAPMLRLTTISKTERMRHDKHASASVRENVLGRYEDELAAANAKIAVARKSPDPRPLREARAEAKALSSKIEDDIAKELGQVKSGGRFITPQERSAMRNTQREAHAGFMGGQDIERATRANASKQLDAAIAPLKSEYSRVRVKGKQAGRADNIEGALERVQLHLWANEAHGAVAREALPALNKVEQQVYDNLHTVFGNLLRQGREGGFLRRGTKNYGGMRLWEADDALQAVDNALGRITGRGFTKGRTIPSVFDVANRGQLVEKLKSTWHLSDEAASHSADQLFQRGSTRLHGELLGRRLQRGLKPTLVDDLVPSQRAAVGALSNADSPLPRLFRSLDDPSTEGHVGLRSPDELEQNEDLVPFLDELDDTAKGKSLEADIEEVTRLEKIAREAGDTEHADELAQVLGKLKEETDELPTPSATAPLYHGTTAETAAAIRETGSFENRRRRATWLAANPELAKQYGDNILAAGIAPKRPLDVDSSEFADLVAENGGKIPSEDELAEMGYDVLLRKGDDGWAKVLDPSIIRLQTGTDAGLPGAVVDPNSVAWTSKPGTPTGKLNGDTPEDYVEAYGQAKYDATPNEDPLTYGARLPDTRSDKTYLPVTDPRQSGFYRVTAQAKAAGYTALWRSTDKRVGRDAHDSTLLRQGDPVRHGPEQLRYYDAKENQEYMVPVLGGQSLEPIIGTGRLWPTHVVVEMHRELERMTGVVTPFGGRDQALEALQSSGVVRAMTQMRWGVTSPFPAYHVRNMISDALKSLQADTGVLFHPLTNAKLAMGAFGRRTVPFGDKPIKVRVPGVGRMDMPDFLFMADMMGIRSSEHLADFGAILQRSGKAPSTHAIPQLAQAFQRGTLNFGARREDVIRLQTFMQRMRRNGGDAADASWYMVKHHFDYGDLTIGERRFARNLFFFYTWYRKNVPLQFQELITRPGFMVGIGKAYEASEEGAAPWNVDLSALSSILPDLSGPMPKQPGIPGYPTDRLAGLPVSWNGRSAFFAFGAPWADMALVSGEGLESMVTMLNPIISGAYQLASQKDPLSGRDLREREPSGSAGLIDQVARLLGLEGLPRDSQDRPTLPRLVHTFLSSFAPGSRAAAPFASLSGQYDQGRAMTLGRRFGIATGVTPFIFKQGKTTRDNQVTGLFYNRQKYLQQIANLPEEQRVKLAAEWTREHIASQPIEIQNELALRSYPKDRYKSWSMRKRRREMLRNNATFPIFYDLDKPKKDDKGGGGDTIGSGDNPDAVLGGGDDLGGVGGTVGAGDDPDKILGGN